MTPFVEEADLIQDRPTESEVPLVLDERHRRIALADHGGAAIGRRVVDHDLGAGGDTLADAKVELPRTGNVEAAPGFG
jgi:hypothetical protein